jgi:hypothetical protein
MGPGLAKGSTLCVFLVIREKSLRHAIAARRDLDSLNYLGSTTFLVIISVHNSLQLL